MSDEKLIELLSRRGFLGTASAALAATGLISASTLAQQTPGKPDNSVTANPALNAANPDSLNPPPSDAGGLPPFKYPSALGEKIVANGGWVREVTVRELAIAKTISSAQIRLNAGAIRELHWHSVSEWAFVLDGNCRITCIDSDGKSFVTDVSAGDLWYFPSGTPHSLQGLDPNGSEFLLAFDDGNFSERVTALVSDWLIHTPREILAKNFGLPQQSLQNLPTQPMVIFPSTVPGPLAEDRRQAAGSRGPSSTDFAFRTLQQSPTKSNKGGEVRIIDSKNFPVANRISAAVVTVHPGGMRELHWHPNADEWQFFISGKARQTVFATAGRARTMDFETGDVGYVPLGAPHYIENTGSTDLKFLELFRSSYYQDVSLNEWLANTPAQVVTANLGIDKASLDKLPHTKPVFMPE
ncbi:MAG TPA: cupin domain-containing protein [Candidatus Nitrosotalea sp.]|nr:cupin domain-containing protein [Candidatus Nitrosotalea sp.]